MTGKVLNIAFGNINNRRHFMTPIIAHEYHVYWDFMNRKSINEMSLMPSAYPTG